MKSHRLSSAFFYLLTFLCIGPLVTGEEKKQSQARPQAVMEEKHFEIFEKYCLDCHDSDSEKGGVNLEDLAFDIESIESAELWQKILNVTNSGEMPPKDKDQLTDAEKTTFLSDLSRELVIARDILSDSGGVITMRRLNRREYENTIESLLGVKVNASDLPDDANPGGFDTTGSALFFSSDQFEQYIKIARRALDEAMIFGEQPKVKKLRIQPETSINKFIQKQANGLKVKYDRAQQWRNSKGKPPTDFGFIDDARVVFEEGRYNLQYPTYRQYLDNPLSKKGALLYNFFRGGVGAKIVAPKSPGGKFVVRASVAVLNDEIPEKRRFIEYGTTSSSANGGEINVHGFKKVNGTIKNPQIVEIEFEPGNAERTFSIRERQINNMEASKRFFRQSWSKNKLGPPPALWIDWIEIEGPFYENWPPQDHNALFLNRPEDTPNHRHLRDTITAFATKAFRTREPSKAYIDKMMKLYYSKLKDGAKNLDATKDVLAIVLASPGFLYIQEPTHGEKRRELSPTELAVRLSYFLWSSPPDETLMASAESGKIVQPAELRQQVRRMLTDPRSDEFIHGFAHQWLHMERLNFFQFNYEKYPTFDSSVKESARHEVYEMIKDGINNGRPIVELLKSDHVMINNLLANYYGIDGVEGEHFQRVPVPDGMPRGGLLGSAAIMAMGSDGEKASPVERGSWVLRSLLNNPPPPAPANVPQLSRLEGKPLSAREMTKAHQEEPQCAQCHQTIDPLGFGLLNFDAVGLWRDAEIFRLSGAEAKRAKKNGKPVALKFPIDASGTMPDGTEFSDFYQLRDRIAEHEEAFARGFTENLIEYALGRPFGFTDQNMADAIMRRAKKNDYAMTEFILGVVQSKRFKLK